MEPKFVAEFLAVAVAFSESVIERILQSERVAFGEPERKPKQIALTITVVVTQCLAVAVADLCVSRRNGKSKG